MKVVVVSGICVLHDAISNAVVEQASLIRGLPGVESVAVIAQYCDRPIDADRVIQVADAWSFLRLPDVRAADVIIFHWGIAYDVFDALVLLAHDSRVIVHFHNVTPVRLVETDQSPIIERSLRQIEMLAMNQCRIWAVSEFNEQTLHAWGVDPMRIRVVAFPIEAPRTLARKKSRGARVRLLTVGRLVSAKGADVLLEAVARHVARHGADVDLKLAGNLKLSDSAFIEQLRRTISDHRLDDVVSFIDNPSDDELWRLYEWADVVVTPSLHEGLCVPVIEGYLAGCRAVATTAGNLPNIVFPPDALVEAGDAGALAKALERIVEEVQQGNRDASPRAVAFARQFRRSEIIALIHDELHAMNGGRCART